MNKKIICTACGTQYNTEIMAGRECPVCNDERQYVPDSGQSWTNLDDLQNNYSIIIKRLTDNLYELKSAPAFAIGQRALLILTPKGNILWDCIALINEPAITFIRSKGGLRAVAISHPHYYTTMNEWAKVFDCPVYIHNSDAEFVFNKGKNISFWNGVEKELWQDMKLINTGGHFPGSCILHAPFLSEKGAILCGDTVYVSPGKKHAAVMYSYPNRIPLPVAEAKRVLGQLLPVEFDTLFGFYDFQNLTGNAKEIIEASLLRYT